MIWPVHRTYTFMTIDWMLVEFTPSKTSRLIIWSYNTIPSVEQKARMWNIFNFLMFLRTRFTIRIREGETTGTLHCTLIVSLTCLCYAGLALLRSHASALLIWAPISLSREPSQDILLPRYLKVSTLASWVPFMYTDWEIVRSNNYEAMKN